MKISKIFSCFPQTNDNEVTQTFYLWVSHNFCSHATNLERKDVPFHLTLAWACASLAPHAARRPWEPHTCRSTTTNDIFILRWSQPIIAKLMNNGPEKVHRQSQLHNLLHRLLCVSMNLVLWIEGFRPNFLLFFAMISICSLFSLLLWLIHNNHCELQK